MSTNIRDIELDTTEYPDSDGEPMAENNEQLRLIFYVKNELDSIYADDTDVAVEGDLLWYPVQYHPGISRAPDAMVIFGRPKQYRGSYKQWEEDNIAPQVVFEILSPSNDEDHLIAKRNFYETYGVEEYYEYDPDGLELRGWQRLEGLFQAIESMNGWVSPRLGIRFETVDGQLFLYRPDGRPFRSYIELNLIAEQAEQQIQQAWQRAEEERQRTEQAQLQALAERQRAEAEQQKAEQAQLQMQAERKRAERLAARLRELELDPDNL